MAEGPLQTGSKMPPSRVTGSPNWTRCGELVSSNDADDANGDVTSCIRSAMHPLGAHA